MVGTLKRCQLIMFPLLAAFCVSCFSEPISPSSADFSAKLPHGYFIHRTSAHQVIIAPEMWNSNTPIIPAKVVELDHDDRFLIAKQQLLERRSPNDPKDSYEQPKPDAFQYWILDFNKRQLSGPLTIERFETERTRLGVTSSLKLHNVDDHKPSL